jgi:CPA1 family monovalent cation:H+ antiporter
MSIFEISAFLIGLSAVFGYLNYRFLRLPHTVGLVMIALAASLVVILIEVLTPASPLLEIITGVLTQIDFYETVMHGMLSFLLFAGALHVDFNVFKSRGS